ncbi:MAG: MarR family winged helix-turn-helix transcriptional regulator [Pseudomonadota bacterium]|nr:MarR family winged helix-turn-helix transcriptional regulator [Pseudomonadota bacterium]
MSVELRVEQALKLWQSVSMGLVHDDKPDLTLRQMTILLTIYLEPPPHTVRGLAARLHVTKPVITRALDTMGQMKLVKRRRDENDRRNVVIQRTLEGSLFLEALGDLVRARAYEL